jgi:cell division protein ZapA (FtsZ GTPase activity inhibitor)
LGVISYFLLKEVKEVVVAGGGAIGATGQALKESTGSIAIIAVVVLAALYVAYRVWVRA